MSAEGIIALASSIISFLAFCISVITFRAHRSQKKIDNLVAVHQFLHDSELSEARRKIREGEVEITLRVPEVRRVCSSFDFAATLVRHGAVDKVLFMDYWSRPICALAEHLSPIANAATGTIKVKEYYKDFWWLIDEAKAQQSV